MARTEPRSVSLSALALLLLAFLPLAFSDELLDNILEVTSQNPEGILAVVRPGWLLLAVDGLLLLLMVGATVRLWGHMEDGFRRAYAFWWAVGAAGFLLVDLAREYLFSSPSTMPSLPARYSIPLPVDGVLSLVAVAALAILVAAALGLTPRDLLARRQPRWEDFRALMPLLVGVLVGYATSSLYEEFFIRRPALDKITNPSIVPITVSPEYFAQMSQIIPILLVGVAFEGHLFRRIVTSPVEKATLVVFLVVLFLGEVLAISALPFDKDSLRGWHEYFALVFVVQSVAVGLAALGWAIMARVSTEEAEEVARIEAAAAPAPAGSVLESARAGGRSIGVLMGGSALLAAAYLARRRR